MRCWYLSILEHFAKCYIGFTNLYKTCHSLFPYNTPFFVSTNDKLYSNILN